MKYGVISDIHGNYEGLLLAVRKLEENRADIIICLGDLVDGGNDDAGVIDYIIRKQYPTVKGNHDEINNSNIGKVRQSWLDQLPAFIDIGDICFTHISPRKARKKKVKDCIEAWNVFDETPYRRIFVGHTHVSCIFTDQSDCATTATEIPLVLNDEVNFKEEFRYIISVGAIGYSRDSRKSIRCGLYNELKDVMTIYSIVGPMNNVVA